MKKKFIEFINLLHGYLIRIKEIHWNTESNAQHLLCDDIQDTVMDIEDRFAECAMGMDGNHFKIGDLEPMVPNAEELLPMLKELEGDIKDMKEDIDEEDGGLLNILDEALELVNKYKYRATQK